MIKSVILTDDETNERFVSVLFFDVIDKTTDLKEAIKNAVSDYLEDKKYEDIYFNWWDICTHFIPSHYFKKYGISLIESDNEMAIIEDFKESLNKNFRG